MPVYDINRPEQSRITFFDLAGRTIDLFESEPLNAFDSMDAMILETEKPLEEYFWSEPHAVSPWNSYWTEAARYRGGLQINDPVFKDSWTKYYGLHVDCQNQEICYCEHNCGGTHTTKGRAVTNCDTTVKPPRLDSNQWPTTSQVAQWNDFPLYPKEEPNDEDLYNESVISWSNYQNRKLDKGKTIDRSLHPAPLPTPLIIVTQPDGHEVFVW